MAVDNGLIAEMILASIGLIPVLEGKPKQPKPRKLRKDIRGLLDRFLARPSREPLDDIPDFDYDEAVHLLDNAGTETAHAALHVVVPRGEIGDAVEHAATAIITALQQTLPRAAREDVTGTVAIRPREMAVARFARAWEVAKDPLIVLRNLCQGSMTIDEVTALRAFWPALYGLAKSEVLEAIAELRTARPTWELEPRRDRLIRVFMGQAPINFELARDMQKMLAAPAASPPGGKSKATPSKADEQGPLLTPGQEQ